MKGTLTLFIAMFLAVVPTMVEAKGYKAYCQGAEFSPDTKYPHVHCGKDFYTLSKTSSSHINIMPNNKAVCKTRLQSAFDYANAMTTSPRKNAILDSLRAFQTNGECG